MFRRAVGAELIIEIQLMETFRRVYNTRQPRLPPFLQSLGVSSCRKPWCIHYLAHFEDKLAALQQPFYKSIGIPVFFF